jgi:hypothetical protein
MPATSPGDSYALAFDILEKAHVGVTPGIDFGPNGEGYLRFSYANSLENIKKGSTGWNATCANARGRNRPYHAQRHPPGPAGPPLVRSRLSAKQRPEPGRCLTHLYEGYLF